jgi:hypothetical protein
MPPHSHAGGCAVVGHRMYISGNLSESPTICFDAEASSWSSLPTMLSPRQGHGLVAVGTNIFAVGGHCSSNEPVTTVECHATNGRAGVDGDGTGAGAGWASVSEGMTPRHSMGCVAVGGGIVVAGGFTWVGGSSSRKKEPTATVQSLSPVSLLWSDLPDLPAPRVWLTCVALNGNVYAIGGESELLEPVATLFVLADGANSWREGPSMVTKRSRPGAAVVEGKIHVCGGSDGTNAQLATVEIFDPITDRWTAGTSMTRARAWHSAAVLTVPPAHSL